MRGLDTEGEGKFKENFSSHVTTFKLNISWPLEGDLVFKK